MQTFDAFLPAGKQFFDPRNGLTVEGGASGKNVTLPASGYFLALRAEGTLTDRPADPPPGQQRRGG